MQWCKQAAIQECTVHTCTYPQNTPTLRAKFPTSNERSYLALGPFCSTARFKWCSSILIRLIFFLASEPTKLKGILESSIWGYNHNTARQPAPMTPFIHSLRSVLNTEERLPNNSGTKHWRRDYEGQIARKLPRSIVRWYLACNWREM